MSEDFAEDAKDLADAVKALHDRLATVEQRVEAGDSSAQLYAALSRAQGAFPPIPRNRTVTVRTKTGGSYKFDYAPLETILDCVRQPLADEGLAISQALLSEEGHTFLETALLHANGGHLSSKLVLSRAEQLPPQELGSLLTYLRRYSLQALLGIATEEDDDANSASGNTVTKQETRPKDVGERTETPQPTTSTEARSPAEPPLQRREAMKQRWQALSLAEAKAKPAEFTDPNLLRELLIFEGERKGGQRATVLSAISRRIEELEGEPEADSVPAAAGAQTPVSQAEDGTVAVEPAEPLQDLLACLAFIAEQPEAVENPSYWTPTNVLVGLSSSGAGNYGKLEEVPREWLGRVLERVPAEVRGMVSRLGPEAKGQLAGQAA